MKKMVITLFSVLLTVNVFGQMAPERSQPTNPRPIYVLFTSVEEYPSNGVDHVISYDTEVERSASHVFRIVNFDEEYGFSFCYFDFINEPNEEQFFLYPPSYLDTVEYLIDWDKIGPSLTKEQAFEKYREITSHKFIIFVDRKMLIDGKYLFVPVKVPVPMNY